MASRSAKRGRKPHNFGSKSPRISTRPKSITAPDSSKRLVRKYKKFQTDVQVDHQNNSVSHSMPATDSKVASEVSTVPQMDPIPDTGLRATYVAPVLTYSYTTKPSSTLTISVTSTAFFLSAKSHPTTVTTVAAAIESPSFPLSNPRPPPSHNISVAVIALISVGAACALVAIFILLRACSRPRHKSLPTPSLPILEDSWNGFEPKESPVFGGIERFSSQTSGNAGLWAWSQYHHPKPAVPPVPEHNPCGMGYNPVIEIGRAGKIEPTNSVSPSPRISIAQAHQALTRATSKISVASLYSESPGPVQPLTADGHPLIKRSSKVALRRNTLEEKKIQESPTSRFSELAYIAAEMPSPKFVAESVDAPISTFGGRSRVKSTYYTPGCYPRTSSIPTSLSAKAKAEHDTQFDRTTIERSESRRERDTKALAAALGFGSPAIGQPSSPQPTLYPDDSLSVVSSRRPQKRNQRKLTGPQKHELAPAAALDTTDLGNLMLMDFGTTNKSLATLAGRFGDDDEPGELCTVSSKTIVTSGSAKFGTRDRPPRVPSPPPLPSLTQMGLEHSNPQAYADYRSPTYSIYNLYEEGRKSLR